MTPTTPAQSNEGASHFRFVTAPKLSKWKCILVGHENHGAAIFHPAEGSEPRWFHRQMHRLMFGFKWVKEK